MRAGIGYDAHRLVEGRPLILGGVQVPFPMGLLGHSDGDALVHAIIDALLGAAHMGDMGTHFPSSDPSYKDADSGGLLERVAEMLRGAGWKVVNVDATMVAERPVLAPFIDSMRLQLARRLGVDRDLITVKAKTNDGLGFLGAGEGMAVWAVALLQEPG